MWTAQKARMMAHFRALTLSDEVLKEANAAFDWRAATALPDGRMLDRTFEHKRSALQAIPDKRIIMLVEWI